MPEVTVRSADGGAGATLALRDDVFGRAISTPLLHQAVVIQQANKRQGTHDTLTRAEVSRTTKKVWRQKGTGRARQGSRKGPHWTGGGVAHGPHPRSYRMDMPKKMRAAAICGALSAKAQAGQLVVVPELTMEKPSTKTFARTLASVAPAGSVLLVLDSPNPTVRLSARNLPHVTTVTTENVNVYDILRHDQLVLTQAAVRVLEDRYGRDNRASGASAETAEEAPSGRRSRADAAATSDAVQATE